VIFVITGTFQIYGSVVEQNNSIQNNEVHQKVEKQNLEKQNEKNRDEKKQDEKSQNVKNQSEENQFEMTARENCLMEAISGTILLEKNSKEHVSIASVTKIMTLLLIYDALEKGIISKEDLVTTSSYAKSMGGSQVFLEEGEKQSVETMIKCIVIASGNDAAVAMAEHIAGSEQKFVELMNERCTKLEMNDTHFEDCTGLTDSDNHYSCARDVAVMSRELIVKYPDILKYSSIWMETIIHSTNKGDKEFVLTNTNKLLKGNESVLGLKTGSTSKAKYCVSVVAKQDNITLISVILGAKDYKVRFKEANELLKYGFANCSIYSDDSAKKVKCEVKGGLNSELLAERKDRFCYVFKDEKKIIEKKIKRDKEITAPVKKGQKVGKVEYYIEENKIGEVDLISCENVKKAHFVHVFYKIIQYIVAMM
jgi:D-alanyl-D-alanine carboxypeptidase (penicillin-binding protein 5/6)